MSLFGGLDRFANRVAVVTDGGETLTYRQLLARGDDLLRGAAPRGLLLLLCSNTVASLAVYLGAMRRGLVPILVHHTIRPEQRADIVARLRPDYVAEPTGDGYVVAASPQVEPTRAALHSDLALLLPTSGTTGGRQFVRLSYKNLLANSQSIIAYLGVSSEDRAITTLPMNYAYGLSVIHSHLMAGASLIVSEKPLVSPDFWRLARDQRMTTFAGVPFTYEMLKKLRLERMDLPALRYFTQAGGRLADGLVSHFHDLADSSGRAFVVMYGQTEATARIAYVPPDRLAEKIGSIGCPIPGVTLRLAGEDGSSNAGEELGELVCSGDNVSMGYAATAQDLTLGDVNKGVLFTGDLARRDRDGYFHIVGRKKRFLKLYGHRVSLDEVELNLREAGFDCACAGEDDDLKIFVAGGVDAEFVRQEAVRLMRLHHQSLTVLPVNSIPRADSGKIDYRALQQDKCHVY